MDTESEHGEAAPSPADGIPPILGLVELPSSLEVRRHNWHSVRFRGWVTSTRGWPTFVRAHGPGRQHREVQTTVDRPDVLAAIGADYGLTDANIGFELYVELPRRPWRRPPEIAIEFTDGEITVPSARYRVEVEVDVENVLETYENDSAAKRALAAKWLEGRGLEFGALHQPLTVDNERVTVSYADRLTKPQALEMFPELAENFGTRMVEPDFIVDLDTGDLSQLASEGFDFFVANDVIEHLASPLRFLKSVHDVMKPGARLFLSVPDRRFTHDADRPLTSKRHLWREYKKGTTEVDDRHIEGYLAGSERVSLPKSGEERQKILDRHRQRSVHAHVWDNNSFDALLAYAQRRLPLQFEILDAASSEQAAGAMVYVLERK
jgi:SAM-dependent methyltransferase